MNEQNKSTGESADDIIRHLKEKAEKERQVSIEPYSSIETENKDSQSSESETFDINKKKAKKKADIIDEEFIGFFTTPIAVNKEFPSKKEPKKKSGIFGKKLLEKTDEEELNVAAYNADNLSDKAKNSGIYKNFTDVSKGNVSQKDEKSSKSEWQSAFTTGENYPPNVATPNIVADNSDQAQKEVFEEVVEVAEAPVEPKVENIAINHEDIVMAEPATEIREIPVMVTESHPAETISESNIVQITAEPEIIAEESLGVSAMEEEQQVDFFHPTPDNTPEISNASSIDNTFNTAGEIDLDEAFCTADDVEAQDNEGTQLFDVTAEDDTQEVTERKSAKFFTSTISNLKVPLMRGIEVTRENFDVKRHMTIEDQIDTDPLEYETAADAPSIKRDLLNRSTAITLRLMITSIIAAVLVYITMAARYTILPLPRFMQVDMQPKIYLTVCLIILIAASILNIKTLINGICGLAGEPTQDIFVTISVVFSFVQLILLISVDGNGLTTQTIFCGIAVVGLALNTLGKKTALHIIRENFNILTSGVEQSVAYTMQDDSLAKRVTRGLAQTQPTVLVSRSTSIVNGFLKNSYEAKSSDKNAKPVGLLLAGACVLSGGYIYLTTKDATLAASCAAGAACLGASFAATLINAVPTGLMQNSASRVGAVIAGAKAVENLVGINVIGIKGKDLFPHGTISLKGIKTFREERIDLAILYAASILVEASETLNSVFLALVEGKRDLLYKVENLSKDVSNGYSAYIEGNDVIVGNRQIMINNSIEMPTLELEKKYTKDDRMPVYLAVSGKLFGMFILDYNAEEEMYYTVSELCEEKYSLLVKTDDFCISNTLVARCYGISPDLVKVMDEEEQEIMKPYTAYAPTSEGDITHLGSFASYVGGLRAAKSAASAEKMAAAAQIASVVMALIIIILLTLTAGLGKLSVFTVLMYQLSWLILTLSMPLLKRY